MSEDQQWEADIEKVSAKRQPWTEAWEQTWEAYQGQQRPGGDKKVASLRNTVVNVNNFLPQLRVMDSSKHSGVRFKNNEIVLFNPSMG